MTSQEYFHAVERLPYGKTLPTARYLLDLQHESVPWQLRAAVSELRARLGIGAQFNVLKFGLRQPRISFLSYPDFDRAGHPALDESVVVDLVTGKMRRETYRARRNPPILHRKERFVPTDYAHYAAFRQLTDAEERAGLLEDTSHIGFRLNWEESLAKKGYVVQGHRLVVVEHSNKVAPAQTPRRTIARDRTALMRSEVSKPVKLMLEFKQLRPGAFFFDYGCGHGFDVRAVADLGFKASGWDPAHAPEVEKKTADVVNLGFVLNVIENPAERVETLLQAWGLTKRLLVVSTLVAGREAYEDAQNFGDGVVTSRSTFQKYYEQGELHALLEDTLEHEAVPVSLGIFFVFRETADLHDFLAERTKRFIDWENISRRLGLRRALQRSRDPYDEHRELLSAYWERLLELGRTPRETEFERLGEVRRACGSIRRAFSLFADRFGEETFAAARGRRREDLLVYAAAAQLRKKIPFTQLSAQLQNDIRSHFGSYTEADKAARELLFASGDEDELELALGQAKEGWIDSNEGHWFVHRDVLDELPGIFRVYVACAARLFGDPREADLIKFHLHSKKLTFLHYADFADPFPELTRRIKIDLRRLFVTVFESPPGPTRQVLLFKERFLPTGHAHLEEAQNVSRRLRAHGIDVDSVGHGPTRGEFDAWLAARGLDRLLRKKPSSPTKEHQ